MAERGLKIGGHQEENQGLTKYTINASMGSLLQLLQRGIEYFFTIILLLNSKTQ